MRRTVQIISALLVISGLFHTSGLYTNQNLDFAAGICMLILGSLSLVADFFKNDNSFSLGKTVVIYKKGIKWIRLKELLVAVGLFWCFINGVEQVSDSVVMTFFIYFSLLVILDHRKSVEITEKRIVIDSFRISFDRIKSVDFRQREIVLMTEEDPVNVLGYIKIDLSEFDDKNRELLIASLRKG